MPGLNLKGVEWASYRVDRAEQQMPGNKRPEHCAVIEEGNVLTCWPTKLALAPILAADIIGRLDKPAGREKSGAGVSPGDGPDVFAMMPRPDVAPPPWEMTDAWTQNP